MSNKGFFSGGQDLLPVKVKVPYSPQCGQCKLKNIHGIKELPVIGEGKKGILIVLPMPTKTENDTGKPLNCDEGKYLDYTLDDFDIDLKKDCWITYAIRCHSKGCEEPNDKQIEWCRPNLASNSSMYGEINKLKPKTIVLFGNAPVKSVIGWLWKEDTKKINRWAGRNIPCQELNTWICPVWDMKYVIEESKKSSVIGLMWKNQLQKAFSHTDRPWKVVPDYKKEVKPIESPIKAAEYIQKIIDAGKPTAWDIETFTLKPDGIHAGIVSCSMCNGDLTISYTWNGEAKKKTLEFLKTNIPKIGYNIKFETRYLKAVYNVDVKNWIWDGMLAAHVLDNRPDSKSLKYQSFCLLGQESYDEIVKPYFQAPSSNSKNRITELDTEKLLIYGGLDALLEYKVAQIQMKQFDYELD